MVRTGEEKIKCDDYRKKGGEAESIVEVEETHVVRCCMERSSLDLRLYPSVTRAPVTLCTISSRASTNISPGSQGALVPETFLIRTRKDEFSVIIIGLDGVGKTVCTLASSITTGRAVFSPRRWPPRHS